MVRRVLSVWLKEDGEQWEYLVRMFKAEGAASIKALKKVGVSLECALDAGSRGT